MTTKFWRTIYTRRGEDVMTAKFGNRGTRETLCEGGRGGYVRGWEQEGLYDYKIMKFEVSSLLLKIFFKCLEIYEYIAVCCV